MNDSPTELNSESYVTTDGQSASVSWNKAPIWGLRPDFHYCQTVAGLLMWGAVSDERTDLSFTIDAWLRQRSHSRVRVPWDSRPYFTVSDSRFRFSSPPTTRRATVEVFDPASTRVWLEFKVSHNPTDGVSQSISLGVEPHLWLMTRYLLLFDSYGLVFVGRPLWREGGSVVCHCYWHSPGRSFSGTSPFVLATIFYCLRFETSFFVASYDSQGHGGGIPPRLHTG
jgi:hypothetical protein